MTDESIFAEALAIPDPAERAAYLDRMCRGNHELRQQVEALLAAHEAGSPLDQLPESFNRTGPFVSTNAMPSDRVGPYKLLEKIGEGGMGEVWVADQLEPIKRRVALKLIKPGMDSRSVLGRFEAERQALAVMDHPNIAKVLDAGTTPDGRPFFVMELVKGTPITQFCDARKLTPNERLELFIPVCQAIQHAHMKGIIHRDIKPSNVLVALHDEVPVPKVIDFGVAKAIGQQLTEKTIYTGFGALVGTPAYMAPEQATFNQLDVDTRADVYALGVVLYELLAGSPPIEWERLKKAALDEVLQIVRDEEPPRPSQRLSTSHARASIAAVRGSEPTKLSALMKGELDWIVMKALEKDRTRRYESANGFAADVQRYLSGEPVQAVPPTLGYRLGKAYRRNKASVLTLAVVSWALFVGLSLAVIGFLKAETDRKRAEIALASETHTRQLLDQATSARAEAEQAKEKLAGIEYSRTIGLSYREYLAGHLGRSNDLLNSCSERYRGWEWHYLARMYHPEEIRLPHDANPSSAAFNPDASLVVTASYGNPGSIRLWESATGRLLRTIELDDTAGQVTFTPDGSGLVTAHFASARLWRLSDGKELLRLPHADTVFSATMNPAGTRIATSCQDRKIRVWDASTGKELLAVDRYKRSGGTIQFSPDGKKLVFVNGADPLVVIDAESGAELEKLYPTSEYAQAPKFSSDGTQLAYAVSGHVEGVEVGTGKHKQTTFLGGGFRRISDLSWTPDNKCIATGYEDGMIRLWDVSSRSQLTSFYGHANNVNTVDFSRDGKFMVTTGGDRTVRIWNLSRLPRDGNLRPGTGVSSLALSTDGRRCVVGGNGEIQVWDLTEGKQIWIQKHGKKWVVDVAFSSDGRRVVSAGDDHSIVVWNAADGKELAKTVNQVEAVRFCEIHPNGGEIATNGPNGALLFLSVETLQITRTVVHPAGEIWCGVFSPDGTRFASSAAGDNKIRIWDTSNWTPLCEIDCQKPKLNALRFSADGTRLVGRFGNEGIPIIDVPTRRLLRTLPSSTFLGSSLALSPDGSRVAVQGDSGIVGEVHIWDVDMGSELIRLAFRDNSISLNIEPSSVFPMAFTADGHTLVTGAFDQSIRVWDGTPLRQRPPVLMPKRGAE